MSSDGAIAIAGKGEIGDTRLIQPKASRVVMPVTVLRVFISTTAGDLAQYRDQVHQKLADTNFFQCVSQKTMGAQNSAAMDFCRKQIEAADLFIGLIGFRRGWEPSGDPKNRSITEMEHDWAEALNRPRYLYVAPDGFNPPTNVREPDAKYDRQMAFRERLLAHGKIIVSQSGFDSPELLAAEIVQRLLSDQLLALLADRGELKRAEAGGLERETVLKLAKRLKPDDALDFDSAAAELENAITIALDVIARGKRGSNEDEFVNDVLKRVGSFTQTGENERAVQALDDALKELDTRETEQREALKRSRLTLLEAGIEQDILRRNAPSAARRVEQTVAIEHPHDAAVRLETLRNRQKDFLEQGRDKGINLFLEIAIEIARRCVDAAPDDRRGRQLNELAIALGTLGERESGSVRLEEAIAVSRQALERYPRDRFPRDWAGMQNNLGNVLWMLAEREGSTSRANKAVMAYREALKEWTHKRVPELWAMTQNNLGLAFSMLGEYEGDAKLLHEAVTSYRKALIERTRERAPLEWAMTLNNLGITLIALAEHEASSARLHEAVGFYREVLEVWTRERVPLDWATAQNNLGNALIGLGARETGTIRFEEGLAAFREALRERSRERTPVDWATTVGNEGVALMWLADRRSDAAIAKTAVDQIQQALAVLSDAGHRPFAEYFRSRLPEALAIRARLSSV